jgi:hypothetical protein
LAQNANYGVKTPKDTPCQATAHPKTIEFAPNVAHVLPVVSPVVMKGVGALICQTSSQRQISPQVVKVAFVPIVYKRVSPNNRGTCWTSLTISILILMVNGVINT